MKSHRLADIGALILLLLFVPVAEAQDQPQVLVVRPAWHIGETIRFETLKSRIWLKEKQVTQSVKVSWSNTLDVLDVNDNEVVLAWTRGEIRGGALDLMPPGAKAMADIWKDVRMEFVFDARTHRLLRVRNFDEVMKRMDQTLGHARQLLIEKGTSGSKVDQVLNTTRDLFRNPDTLGPLLLKDLTGIVGAYGRELELSARTRYELELPNPLGGPPIPAVEKWESPRIIEGTNAFDLVWTQSIDQETFGRSMRDFATKLTPEKAVEADKLVTDAMQMVIETSGSYRYDSKSGRILHAKLTRNISSGDSGFTESWEWIIESERTAK